MGGSDRTVVGSAARYTSYLTALFAFALSYQYWPWYLSPSEETTVAGGTVVAFFLGRLATAPLLVLVVVLHHVPIPRAVVFEQVAHGRYRPVVGVHRPARVSVNPSVPLGVLDTRYTAD
jgi:hypothetical protein